MASLYLACPQPAQAQAAPAEAPAGDLAEAEGLYKQSVQLRDGGKYKEAQPLAERALAIWERALEPEHPEVAKSLNNLAVLYLEQGKYAGAEPLLKRALAIREKILGPEHPEVAQSLNGLAILYAKRGEYAGAEPLFKRALAIWEKVLGPEHPLVATSLNNLGELYRDRGDYASAEPLYRRALAIWEKALGPEHPLVAQNLYDLTILRVGQGRGGDARQSLRRALDVQEQNLSLNLTSASEARNRAYLASFKDAADLAVWLHLHRMKDDPQAAELALASALGRKGRVLEEAATATARLRRRIGPSGQKSLQQLTDARGQLASLVFKESGTLPPEQYKARVTGLRERVRRLEDNLAEAGSDLRALTRPVTVEAAQKALPGDAALVEFVLYRPFVPGAAKPSERFGPLRYAAYLLRPEGPPLGVDLGEARQVDALVSAWRSWLIDRASPTGGPVRKLARELHKQLLGPLSSQLGAKHLLVAPDGQLNTLPFAALVGDDERYLLEGHTLTYLVSGRELPRLEQKAPVPKSAPLVVGGPDFARAEPTAALTAQPGSVLVAAGDDEGVRSTDNLRSPDLAGFVVRSLPGALAEAKTVADLLGNARLLTGPWATENALKAARSPALLHLATHGFFLRDKAASAVGAEASEPLLRSGVALAGFNARSSGTEDGVLTALEAQGLELEGTRLVVLSACDTGSGPVVGGEGVQGLRRSLALAGAQSQVLSLWPVGDRTTARLMEQFYRGLAMGLGRSEALRRAQLGVSGMVGLSHPYWWAAFAPSGNWRPVTFSTRSP